MLWRMNLHPALPDKRRNWEGVWEKSGVISKAPDAFSEGAPSVMKGKKWQRHHSAGEKLAGTPVAARARSFSMRRMDLRRFSFSNDHLIFCGTLIQFTVL